MIKSMSGYIHRARGLGQGGFELCVTVSFDAKEFNTLRKKRDPLSACMAKIKNVVFDSTQGLVRTIPGYSPVSYSQRFPRAKKGLVTLNLEFNIPTFAVERLGANPREWSLYHKVEMQTVLEQTKDDGHLLAKSAILSVLNN